MLADVLRMVKSFIFAVEQNEPCHFDSIRKPLGRSKPVGSTDREDEQSTLDSDLVYRIVFRFGEQLLLVQDEAFEKLL